MKFSSTFVAAIVLAVHFVITPAFAEPAADPSITFWTRTDYRGSQWRYTLNKSLQCRDIPVELVGKIYSIAIVGNSMTCDLFERTQCMGSLGSVYESIPETDAAVRSFKCYLIEGKQ